MKLKRILSLTLALVLLIGAVLTAQPVRVRAAGYSGSGTAVDPYLVTTAEQLQNMRDDLSAYYKLANNIDLAGVDFKPIGRLNAPFTGSSICELNEDKTPKYAIRNLTVTVQETPYASESANKWEAALFGCTQNATLMGIVLFDVSITNYNVGDNRGSVIYGTYKPGMDEMPTAPLVGQANGGSILYCGATGKVGGKANSSAGLVGRADAGVTIANCFSTVEVTSSGKWGVAGLVGAALNAKIQYCYFGGSCTGGEYVSAAFIGSEGGEAVEVDHCVSEGKADHTFIRGDASSIRGTFSNCANLSTHLKEAEPFDPSQTILASFKNCYYDSAVGAVQHGFTDDGAAARQILDTVKAAVAYQVDVADYLTDAPEASASGGDGAEDPGSDEAAAQLEELVAQFPDPEEIEFKATFKAAVMDAYKVYAAMSMGQQEELDAQLVAKLLGARKKMSMLIVLNIVEAMEQLPEDGKVASEDAESIKQLYTEYQFLDESVSVEIKPQLAERLTLEHQHILESANHSISYVDGSMTAAEWVIVAVCALLILLSAGFHVLAGTAFVKKEKIPAEGENHE